MPATEPRLTWTRMAPEPDDMHSASLGQYVFELSKAPEPGTGYLLQMWQTRPEDWPLLVWEMDGYSPEEAKERAERLADQHVPVIVQDQP
jgi:hypothetical protein